jgi:hypothetical protein
MLYERFISEAYADSDVLHYKVQKHQEQLITLYVFFDELKAYRVA